MLGRPLRADFKTLLSRAAAELYSDRGRDKTVLTWEVMLVAMGHVNAARRHMWQYLVREDVG